MKISSGKTCHLHNKGTRVSSPGRNRKRPREITASDTEDDESDNDDDLESEESDNSITSDFIDMNIVNSMVDTCSVLKSMIKESRKKYIDNYKKFKNIDNSIIEKELILNKALRRVDNLTEENSKKDKKIICLKNHSTNLKINNMKLENDNKRLVFKLTKLKKQYKKLVRS